jgi:hypothetical protein
MITFCLVDKPWQVSLEDQKMVSFNWQLPHSIPAICSFYSDWEVNCFGADDGINTATSEKDRNFLNILAIGIDHYPWYLSPDVSIT